MNLIIVQARLGSSRLPGKVLFKLDKDITLLDFLIKRIQSAKNVDKIIVATTKNQNDIPLINHCKKMNYEYFIGSEDDCLERHFQCAKKYSPKSITKIPSDVPFVDPKIIDKVISLFSTANFDYVSNLHPPTYPDGVDVETFSFSALKKSYLEASMKFHREHTTPYMWDNPNLFKIGSVKSDQRKNYFNEYRFTIDYIEDFKFLSKVYDDYVKNNPDFTWIDIVDFLDDNPILKEINKMHLSDYWYSKHVNQIKNLDKQILRKEK
tara:strand:+ start:1529 stop:2323 length:795 start_codon:yes stop_codon:yes gene_type:complete